MSDTDYKKYAEKARRGIKGEAFFESLIIDHAIPHRIARQNDLGIDYICEWIVGDKPTGILFVVQVKSTTTKTTKLKQCGKSEMNGLVEFQITNSNLKVDDPTLRYLRGLGLPIFLFAVIEDLPQEGHNTKTNLNCYYKRLPPPRDGKSPQDDKDSNTQFFLVNTGSTFLAYADPENEAGGFARDLLIDYVRVQYSKGHLVQLSIENLGFWPFSDKDYSNNLLYFGEFVGETWYRERIEHMVNWGKDILQATTPGDATDEEKPSGSP